MRRRFLLSAVAGAAAASLFRQRGGARAAQTSRTLEEIRTQWRKFVPPNLEISFSTKPLDQPEIEWRKVLSPQAYRVLFEADTERPFSSPLNDEKRSGLFVCAACNLPLFTSEMKFDSGTGWPSFFTHIPEHLATELDFKLIFPRTEYHCVRCGGHQGHVFKDGPPPTGERWCNNGLALNFLPLQDADESARN
jgi:peptide-methionine (R)-S-oxide reductase